MDLFKWSGCFDLCITGTTKVNSVGYENSYQDLFEMYKSSISSNFDIPEFKNIFDINFTITANDESMYEDIDEIIE